VGPYALNNSHDLLPVISCVAVRDEVRGRVLREDGKELVDAPDLGIARVASASL